MCKGEKDDRKREILSQALSQSQAPSAQAYLLELAAGKGPESARALQRARYAGDGCNARAPGRWLETHGGVDASARQLLTTAGDRLRLSARAFHRVLRVARTIADVEGERTVGTAHMAEALAYRPRVPDASVVASMTA